MLWTRLLAIVSHKCRNVVSFAKRVFSEELTHMFNITSPKLIFCDADVIDVVRGCLPSLGIKAEIYSFGGSTKYSRSVDELFNATGKEADFL